MNKYFNLPSRRKEDLIGYHGIYGNIDAKTSNFN